MIFIAGLALMASAINQNPGSGWVLIAGIFLTASELFKSKRKK